MARTYGTATLKGSDWHVEAEPHVMIKARRMFPRARLEIGTMVLRDTEEVCKDLLWLQERYPLAMDGGHRARMMAEAAEYDRRGEAFVGVLSGQIDPKPFDLALPPRRYQSVAADLALRSRGLLIADELGLGKSAMGIAVLTDPRTRPALIVTLTHLPKQWEREFQKFAPNLTTHIIKKGTPYDVMAKMRGKKSATQLDLIDAEFPDVLIINYHKLSGWRHTLAGAMRAVIFDEVQELRRPTSDKYSAAEHIAHSSGFRVGLSATPIYNYGSEFFHVLNIVAPGRLGEHHEFVREWCGGTMDTQGRARIHDPKAFGTYVRENGLMIRRTRQDVGRELPALTRTPHYVSSDAKVLDEVKSSVVELAKFLLERQGTTFERMRVGGELDWKLRQATGLAKAAFVAEFVRMIVESGEKVVLYGWHHAVYSVWADRFKGHKVAFYTGDESPAQKEKARAEFIEGDTQILVMSLRAGAGLDGLQEVCRTVVFGELDWSPGVHEQCIGRVYRDGQKDPVVAYFLVSEGGSDPVIADILGLKKAQIEGVRDPDAELIEKLEAPETGIRRLAESILRAHGEDPGRPVQSTKTQSSNDTVIM
jgi:SNF2 family DNA or RNA helicase